MSRPCEVDGCRRQAGLGIQLILSSDERREATRWLCAPHVSMALRQMADAVDAIAAAKLLGGIVDAFAPYLRDP